MKEQSPIQRVASHADARLSNPLLVRDEPHLDADVPEQTSHWSGVRGVPGDHGAEGAGARHSRWRIGLVVLSLVASAFALAANASAANVLRHFVP
jgi:hypothetical protein